MKVQYLSNGSKDDVEVDKNFVLEEFQQPKEENEEDYGYKQEVKLSKAVIGYNSFKGFLMYIYQMIINRLVRTSHLADISTNKNKKGKTIVKYYLYR